MTETTKRDEREAFEAHWVSEVPEFDRASVLQRIERDDEGRYKKNHVQWAWEAWQARAALATAPEQAGEAVAAIRDRARWFVRDFSREVGFTMSDAQTEVMLNLFLRYAAPPPASTNRLTDEKLDAAILEWFSYERDQDDFRARMRAAIIAATEGK